MLKFSIKNAFRKKTIAILASAGIGFGLMLMFVLGAFNAGVSAQFEENFSKVAGVVSVTEADKPGPFSELPLDTMDIILDSEIGNDAIAYNVKMELSPALTSLYDENLTNDDDSISVLGINNTLDQSWEGPTTKILSGSSFATAQNETILDSRLQNLPDFNVAIGDKITLEYLAGTETWNLTVVGFYDQDDTGAPSFVPRVYSIYTDIETAWQISDAAGGERDIYTGIDIRFPATNNDEAQVYVQAIEELSNEGAFGGVAVDAFSLAEFQDAIADTLNIFNSFTLVISLITAIAGGMGIIVSQLMSVSSRKKEFAILKSTGWKNWHIFKNIIYESLTLGVLGALFGIGLGSLLIALIGNSSGIFGDIQTIVTPQLVTQVISFALSIGVIGGLYPGWKASRVRPVTVLKGE